MVHYLVKLEDVDGGFVAGRTKKRGVELAMRTEDSTRLTLKESEEMLAYVLMPRRNSNSLTPSGQENTRMTVPFCEDVARRSPAWLKARQETAEVWAGMLLTCRCRSVACIVGGGGGVGERE
jgi:hypothetical protein